MYSEKSTVLYIDDDQLNLEIFREFFDNTYHVITLNSTKDAIDILKTHKVKVLISDQCMPNETGIEFVQRINEEFPNIFKIIFTAFSSQDLALKAINEAGVFKFILKPWKSEEVKNSIDNAILQYNLIQEKNELLLELQKKNEAISEAYKNLADSERKFRSIFAKSNDCIYIQNQQREIIEANKSFLNLIGYTENSNNLEKLNAYINLKFPVLFEKPFECLHDSGSAFMEFEIITDKEDTKTIELKSNEISYNNNTYILSILRDTSERKMFERKIVETIIQTQEEEQARYARELHDGLGPLLSTLKMHMEWIANPDNSVNKSKIIEHAVHTIDSAIKSAKEIANNLSPHILQRFGLVNAVISHIDALKETSDVEFAVSSNLNQRLKSNVEFILYRIVLECINNSLKHAGAKKIIIKFSRQTDQLNIILSDNGKGFDVEKEINEGKGMGLFNIQSRIKHIGGEITIKSDAKYGTHITIKIPMN